GPKMIRDGDIKVTGPGGFNQAAAAIIKKRLQPDLPEELPLRPITPPEGLRRVGQLRTTFVNADLGWAVLGWERVGRCPGAPGFDRFFSNAHGLPVVASILYSRTCHLAPRDR